MATNKSTSKTRKTRTVYVTRTKTPWFVIVLILVWLALMQLAQSGFRWQPPLYRDATATAQVTEAFVATEPPAVTEVPEMAAEVPGGTEVSSHELVFVPYESEGGIPFNDSEWNADVAPDEIEVLTAGPATIAGVSLPGGDKRGSVIILLPGEKVVSYKVTGLVAGANWHGSYRPFTKVDETVWRALAADRVDAMFDLLNNCSLGEGCNVIDVLVVAPDGSVVAQWVENK